MELFSPEFFSALLAIIVIDLVLAGDNAIVIALAARNLPEQHRRRAIVWGAAGAVLVRSIMTLGVVWLLKVPGLLIAGGLALLWIAYKLLVNEEHTDSSKVAGSASFVGAMKTIVVADAVMGIDNVLAVAGAAHGSYLLVVLGLLISIPIVIWGSSFLLKATERFPSIIYLGGGVLAWTGVKMVLAEPMLKPHLPTSSVLIIALYVAVVAAILLAGMLRNQSRRMRSALRSHAQVRREFRRSFHPSVSSSGGVAMEKVLIPVDGSNNALAAVREVAEEYRRNPEREVVLLNVQPRFNKHIAQFVSRKNREAFHAEQAERASKSAKDLLARWNVPYKSYVALGSNAEAIADFAKQHGCSRIVVGTARKNSLTRLVQNSVTARLLERAHVPVQVVVGNEASRWERFGVPVGIGAALAAVLIAD